ncbi:MAG: SIS domain-containing protein [Alphaproteobacteria bacterium]
MSANRGHGIVERILATESAAVAAIPRDNPYQAVTALIHGRCAGRGGKIVICGVGKAGEIGTRLASTFCSTGTPAIFLHPLEAAHGNLGVLQRQDVLFLISNSGKTREIVELVPLCRRLVKDVPIVSLTGDKDSRLARLADYVLHTGGPKEVCPLRLTPTTSMTVMGVIGHILVVLQMERLRFGERDYALRHHGGYLGVKARRRARQPRAAKPRAPRRTKTKR